MDAWTGAAGWIAFIWAVIIGLLRERWFNARTDQLRRQLSETERELWHALKRAGHWESIAAGVRNGWRLPVTTIPRKDE